MRAIDNVDWYRHYTQYIYCYIFPGLFPFLGAAAIVTGFERLGTPLPEWLAALIIVPTFPLAIMGFIGILAIDLPGPITPRWIRERNRERRRQHRQRRAERRAARQAKNTT
ncbi:hypothetical protein [Nesterenkonia aerolata]|uniref:Uncharacterized protein n=1 Tax=Nesterenkonia aerolata TaxID=3074079 RepID=A0ABU2DVA2_9MICC|nr:hypothetical protein [Nesterenkonia sp. LY-0111]MDR8020446.1 hypothetical protein [Nesterenkonia sp. LY-0111]